MQNRMPSRRRPPPGNDGSPRRGETVPNQGATQQRAPRMPHERDESAVGQAASEPSGQRIGQIAHDDLERGLVDTDKGPALDQAYDKVREGARNPARKFRS